MKYFFWLLVVTILIVFVIQVMVVKAEKVEWKPITDLTEMTQNRIDILSRPFSDGQINVSKARSLKAQGIINAIIK